MSGKNTSVFGIYPTRVAAEECVDSLRRAGFRNTDISALFPDNAGTKDFAFEKNTKAPEGAATGATSGAVVGGVLGWLAGIGLLAIPGIGPLLAAGPIVAMLAGVGAVGVAGGIVGALVGLGIPEYEALRYEGRVKHGGILLSVHCDDSHWVKRAEEILKATGAEDISSSGESWWTRSKNLRSRAARVRAERLTSRRSLFPFDGTRRFMGQVVVDTRDLRDRHQPCSHGVKQFVGHGDRVGGHSIDGLNRTQHN